MGSGVMTARYLYTVAILTTMLAFPATAQICRDVRNIKSPDGAFTARITQIGRNACGESRIEILNSNGRVLSVESLTSNDGEHGLVVQNAAWTQNSAFFVFSSYSSGGHQANHFPVLFYSRTGNRFDAVEKQKHGPYVTQPDFRLLPPQTVELTGIDDKPVLVDLGSVEP
jgi:hypothetical protein